MQGSLTQFSAVLQQLKQKHANDPQLQQLDALILPTSAKRVKFMSKLAQLCTAICGSSVLFLTGCQHFTQPKAAVTHQVQDEKHFNLQGKIGVRTPSKLVVHSLHGFNSKTISISN